ncbi:MAG TPA: hypothetical protein VFZ34_19115 [Blastocatellia bacterium]|nr:hypothetical protein [Blastocatellia bacterium]
MSATTETISIQQTARKAGAAQAWGLILTNADIVFSLRQEGNVITGYVENATSAAGRLATGSAGVTSGKALAFVF